MKKSRLTGNTEDGKPMTDRPTSLIPAPQGYADWLADLKGRIHTAQQRA